MYALIIYNEGKSSICFLMWDKEFIIIDICISKLHLCNKAIK